MVSTEARRTSTPAEESEPQRNHRMTLSRLEGLLRVKPLFTSAMFRAAEEYIGRRLSYVNSVGQPRYDDDRFGSVLERYTGRFLETLGVKYLHVPCRFHTTGKKIEGNDLEPDFALARRAVSPDGRSRLVFVEPHSEFTELQVEKFELFLKYFSSVFKLILIVPYSCLPKRYEERLRRAAQPYALDIIKLPREESRVLEALEQELALIKYTTVPI